MRPTPKPRSTRLAGEEETDPARGAGQRVAARAGVDERVGEADAALADVEKIFAELTAQLADLTARRNQFESAAREHDERAAAAQGEIAEVERELGRAAQRRTARRLDAALVEARRRR